MSDLIFNLTDRSPFDRDLFVSKDGTFPPVELQILDDIVPFDLTGVSSLTFSMVDEAGELKMDDVKAFIVSVTDGRIKYDWAVGDTDTEGVFFGQFKLDILNFIPSTTAGLNSDNLGEYVDANWAGDGPFLGNGILMSIGTIDLVTGIFDSDDDGGGNQVVSFSAISNPKIKQGLKFIGVKPNIDSWECEGIVQGPFIGVDTGVIDSDGFNIWSCLLAETNKDFQGSVAKTDNTVDPFQMKLFLSPTGGEATNSTLLIPNNEDQRLIINIGPKVEASP